MSCSGDVMCPPNFITASNTKERYTATNFNPTTIYTSTIAVTNSITSGNDMAIITSSTDDISISTTSLSSKVINVTTSFEDPTVYLTNVITSSMTAIINTSKGMHISNYYCNA